jgi:hypothetical protein
MPDLGKKFECYNCRTKFYNLGKPEAICPKCGANQKDAKSEEAPTPAPRPARRAILMEPIPDEPTTNEFGDEPAPVEEAADSDEDDELEEDEEVPDSPRVVEEEEY